MKSSKCYILWVCVCRLGYPSRSAHASYCHLWHALLHNIFTNYFTNGAILEKKVIKHKTCVLIFCTTFAWNISHSKNNWAEYDKKFSIRLHVKCPLFLPDFNKIYLFLTDYRETWNIKSEQRDPNCSMPMDRRADRRDGVAIRFLQFCRSSQKCSIFFPKNIFMCFVCICEQTTIISLYGINWLVSTTKMERVHCAVRTEYLNAVSSFSVQKR